MPPTKMLGLLVQSPDDDRVADIRAEVARVERQAGLSRQYVPGGGFRYVSDDPEAAERPTARQALSTFARAVRRAQSTDALDEATTAVMRHIGGDRPRHEPKEER